MKKCLFLSSLILVLIVGICTTSISMPLANQEENSETKEDNEIYTSNTIPDTEETTTNQTSQIQEVQEENINQNSPIQEENNNVQVAKSSKSVQTEEIKQQDTKQKKTETNYQTAKKTSTTVSTNNESAKSSQTEYHTRYSFIKNYNNMPTENIKATENEIDKIPKRIVNSFYSENWSLSLSNENMSAKYFNGAYSNVKGVTKINTKEIIIQNKLSSIQTSVAHEFGHYLDYYFNYPSAYNDFKEIYNEEVNTFKSRIPNASCVRDETEFFAHTFYYLIKDSSKCTPKAMQFVQKYVNKI